QRMSLSLPSFLTATAPSYLYTLSLHDALPILSLRGVFNYFQPAGSRDLIYRVHVARLAVEMNWQNRFSPGREGSLDASGIDVISSPVGLDRHYRGSGV